MPSPKNPTDPDHNTFELRAGHGNTDKWRGIRLQGSSAFLRPGELRQGVNIRPDSDGYRERGGQAKLIATPVTYQVDGIYDFTDRGGKPGDEPTATVVPGGGHNPISVSTVLRPNALGAYDQFTAGPLAGYGTPSGYSKVTAVADDVIGPVSPLYGGMGIGTYIYSTDNAFKQSFGMTDLAASVASISKLIMKVQIHWLGGTDTQGGNPKLYMGVRLATVDAYSNAFNTQYVDGYGSHIESWDCTASRPGGGSWTPADVNAVECIVQTSRTPDSNSFPPWIAAIFLEVTHL